MTEIRQVILKVLFIIALSLFSSGCAWYSVNIPEKDKLWGGYQYGQEYIVKRDLFLIRPHPLLMPTKIALVPDNSYKGRQLGRFYAAPNSIEAYEKDPDTGARHKEDGFEMKVHVIGVVKAGTILKVNEIKKTKAWTFYYGKTIDLTPYAKILNGPYEGKTVDITDLSIYYRVTEDQVFRHKPEEELLEKR